MKKIKHSKVKNTGLIFELLVRQVAVETMNNSKTAALNILNKHFRGNTELGKELKLYHSIQNDTFIKESLASKFIDAAIAARRTLNESALKREKYNLIKQIKDHFNIESFFKSRVTNYKLHASVYNIFEHAEADEPAKYLRNKFLVMEHVQSTKKLQETKNKLINENDDIRILASKMLIDKFNTKYGHLTPAQKRILKEYINNVTNSEKLKKYINTQSRGIQKELTSLKQTIPSKVVRIKITEVVKLLSSLSKKHITEDKDVLTMLRYYELIDELKKLKGKK
jgi:hypothetical protein